MQQHPKVDVSHVMPTYDVGDLIIWTIDRERNDVVNGQCASRIVMEHSLIVAVRDDEFTCFTVWWNSERRCAMNAFERISRKNLQKAHEHVLSKTLHRHEDFHIFELTDEDLSFATLSVSYSRHHMMKAKFEKITKRDMRVFSRNSSIVLRIPAVN